MRLFGLIGFPLAHSFSEQFFTKKFKAEAIDDCDYRLFPIRSAGEWQQLRDDYPNLCGLNVTIPYKEKIIPFLDALDETAMEVGAVNCIRLINGKSIGYNTDIFGFEYAIKPFLENKYERALVLGSGGAAKAIVYVLKKWGIDYRIVTRTPKSADQIHYTDLSAHAISFFPLIINTTPLGTFPKTEEFPPLPYSALSGRHFLYDVIYNPAETVFLQKGKAAGAQTMNGLTMLQLQAEKSWEIWSA